MRSERKFLPKARINGIPKDVRDPQVIFSTYDGKLFKSLQEQLRRLNYTVSVYTDAEVCRDAIFVVRGLRGSQVSTLLNRIKCTADSAFEIHGTSKEQKPNSLIAGYDRGIFYFPA